MEWTTFYERCLLATQHFRFPRNTFVSQSLPPPRVKWTPYKPTRTYLKLSLPLTSEVAGDWSNGKLCLLSLANHRDISSSTSIRNC